MGCFTDPHFLRVPKSRKSPKRPALPGAVIRVWAVHRPTPFHLLVFHTLSVALNRAFFRRRETRGFLTDQAKAWSCTQGPTRAFLGLGRVLSPPWGETPPQGHTGANRGFGLDCCRAQKSRCLVLHGSGLGVMIAYAENLRFLPHSPARTGTWPAGNPPAP